MKYTIVFFLFLLGSQARSQGDAKPTDEFIISGAVKQPFTFSLKNTAAFEKIALDSIVIYNHLLERKRAVYAIKGVLLKEILIKAGLNEEKPKLYSEFYFTCIATDGYKVVFSWNEIFNTPIGDKLMIVTEAGGIKEDKLDERITVLSPLDKATGRRYLKNLQEIKVERVK